MKLKRSAVFSSLCAAAAAVNKVGHVYTYDPNSAARDAATPPSVNPETARLILAERLGVSQYHPLRTISGDKEAIEHLNTYGGNDAFFEQPNKPTSRVLVWVDNVEDVSDIINNESKYSGHFTITNPPTSSNNNRLLTDLAQQASSLPAKVQPDYKHLTSKPFANWPSRDADVSQHNDYLTVVHVDKPDNFAALAKELNGLITGFRAYEEMSWPITVVVMPLSSSSNEKESPFGTYEMPAPKLARRQKSEALLSPPASHPSSSIGPESVVEKVEEKDPVSPKSPVLGILPACFASQEACEKQTHGCSGHGNCTVSRKGTKGDGGTRDCYSCKCVPTVTHHEKGMEDHRSITYWGGPACQKRDVSTPFWLFVGSGVLLAGLIAGGIGMLYSVGSEELPSVIGAGVSGPQRK